MPGKEGGMPLNETVDSLDGVDERYHGLYVEKDGKFEIDISGLQSALTKERDEKKLLQKEASDLRKTLKSSKSADEMVNDLKNQLEQRDAKIVDITMKNEIRKAALNNGISKDYVDDVVELTKGRFSMDGDRVVVLDRNGDPTNSSLNTFFSGEFKKGKPRFYDGDRMEGSGTPPHSRSGTNGNDAYEAARKAGDTLGMIKSKLIQHKK